MEKEVVSTNQALNKKNFGTPFLQLLQHGNRVGVGKD